VARLTQGTTTLELGILEKVSVTGGDPVFQFFEPLTGLPKPIKLGNEPKKWKFDVTLTADERDTLREMYESGQVCQFVLDDESYNVVIIDMTIDDRFEEITATLTLQEVDITSIIEVG